MAGKKIVAVFGATGYQGGSVVQSLLADKSGAFAVRGITRNPASDKAKALADQGVEVVKADGFKLDEMTAAFAGAWAAFVNTNSEDPSIAQPGGPTELDLGKIIVDAAIKAGVKVFVYSGMASAAETTNGAVPNLAFDQKHAVGQYARSQPSFEAVIDVSPGCYMENHLAEEMAPVFGGWPFQPGEDGKLLLTVPRWGSEGEHMPFISVGADYGDLVHGVLLDPQKYKGKLVQGVSHLGSYPEMLQAFEKATGKKTSFRWMDSWKDVPTFGVPALETVKLMFAFCQHSGGRYYGVPSDLAEPAELKAAAAKAQGKTGDAAKLTTFDSFFAGVAPMFA